MKTIFTTLIIASTLCLPLSAVTPPGLSKKGSTPAGFDKGEKKGWQNYYPPGWDKMNGKAQDHWKKQLNDGRKQLQKEAEDQGYSAQEAESVADKYEQAVRKGKDPQSAREEMSKEIRKGQSSDKSKGKSKNKETDKANGKSKGKGAKGKGKNKS